MAIGDKAHLKLSDILGANTAEQVGKVDLYKATDPRMAKTIKALYFDADQFVNLPDSLVVKGSDIRVSYVYEDDPSRLGESVRTDKVASVTLTGSTLTAMQAAGKVGTTAPSILVTLDGDAKDKFMSFLGGLGGQQEDYSAELFVFDSISPRVYPQYVQKGRNGGYSAVKVVVEDFDVKDLYIAQ
ncbi:hypothetical protein [Levilactobacillus brevis]|uniref:hypothetical protein n=1 Tax=Levilactobacillus brevis TaxID=1580 RepID=UPI003EBA3FDF